MIGEYYFSIIKISIIGLETKDFITRSEKQMLIRPMPNAVYSSLKWGGSCVRCILR